MELLQYPDICSHQYVRQLLTTGGPNPPETHIIRIEPLLSENREKRAAARLWARAETWLSMRRYLTYMRRQLLKERPTLLHAHFGTTGWWFSEMAKKLNIPLIVSFYGADVSQTLKSARWRNRYVELCQRAACLVVLCEEARDRLIALGCPADKIRIWNHPLELQVYQYSPRTPKDTLRLITAARFVEKKGYPFLLKACAELIRAGRDIWLTAVGFGVLKDEIQQQAMNLNLGNRFQLIDTSKISNFDIFYNRILHEHDIFVLSSTTSRSGDDEGGPALSLVLAQATGMPVVCTPFPGARRTVIDGKTGLLCRQDDAKSLAERIAYLADHTALCSQLGVAGNQLVRSEFDFQHQVKEIVAIYRDVLSAPVSKECLVHS